MIVRMYPKVVKSFSKEKIFIELDAPYESVSIKIMPMEKYGIPHKDFRIDESYRYEYLPMVKERDDLYSFEYDFLSEQKYSVTLKVDGKVIYGYYLYAVDEDYWSLRPYKGDTHLHTCRSDGEGTPLEIAIEYRRRGFDFIAITDHHKYEPSLEGRDAVKALTDYFTVFPGEEVHNKIMGYFHIVNFNGDSSVNELIETNEDYVISALEDIKNSTEFEKNVDKDNCAYRIFVANEIRRRGGLAIFAHPFWEDYGEYNAQTDDVIYLFKNGHFDALEVMSDCDNNGNGNNIQAALWAEMRAMGMKIPVVGASDTHRTTPEPTKFNKLFSVVLAKSASDIPESIKNERSVAVSRRAMGDFYCVGPFRLMKYVRFLIDEYYPEYEKLCFEHASELESAQLTGKRDGLIQAERNIDRFNEFFWAI